MREANWKEVGLQLVASTHLSQHERKGLDGLFHLRIFELINSLHLIGRNLTCHHAGRRYVLNLQVHYGLRGRKQ